MPELSQEGLHNLKQCLEAVHYLVMHNQGRKHGWHSIAAKAASSLLRYVVPISTTSFKALVVPADKALYIAGMACRQVHAPILVQHSPVCGTLLHIL
jgi:3-hydroxymyristoyl/3-hydroxydecanoyl-(acyl carrier protein) dehydratase